MLRLVSPEQSERIANDYPSALAIPFADLEAELALGAKSPLRAFNRMIDLYEIVMVTLSLVCTCDVLSRPGPYGSSLERLLRELRENPKLSSGFWWELFRELMSYRFETPAPGPAGELAERYYSGKGKTTEVVRRLDAIPALRNKVKGHAWTLSEEKYTEILDAQLPHLGELFAFADPLRRWVMISPLGSTQSGEGVVNDAELAVGNRLRPWVGRVTTRQALKIDGLYLVRRDSLGDSQEGEVSCIELSPLVVRRRRPGASAAETFLFQGLDKKKVHYLGTASSERIEEELAREVGLVLSTSGRPSSTFSLRSEKLLTPLREHCRRVAASFVQNATAGGIFIEHAYIEPKRIRQQLDCFLESGLPAALFTGMSGIGKTSFAAHLVREWLQVEPPAMLLLPLAADRLTVGSGGLEEELAAAFGNTQPFHESVRFLDKSLGSKEKLVVLVFVDGVDKCQDPEALIRDLGRLAALCQGSRCWRIAATSTPAVLESYLAHGGEIPLQSFYQPAFGSGGAQQSLPCVSFTMLEADETAQAYAAYRAAKGSSPVTSFEELPAETVVTLSNPLILRMAMELYDGRKIPAGVLNADLMREFAARRVFGSMKRVDLVSSLLDLMLAAGRRSVSLAELLAHPSLRQYCLDEDPSSPFVQLRDEQVLTIVNRPAAEELPFPPAWSVEFSFDRVLEYLAFWKLFSASPENLADPARLLPQARSFAPVRGALLFLYGHFARSGRYEQLNRLLLDKDDWMDELLADVLRNLIESDGQDRGVADLVRSCSGGDRARVARLCGALSVRLFDAGRWQEALKLIRIIASLDGLPPAERILQKNRLVLLEKNMDRWDEALRLSDECLEHYGNMRDETLYCRILVNRSSVLYDLGPRSAAHDVLVDAEKRAAAIGKSAELAAVKNNLGLYYLYSDRLDPAEARFSEALDRARDQPIATAYIQNNFGLLRLSRSLRASDELNGAFELFCRAYETFGRNGHLQGLSYSASNLGAVHLARGEIQEGLNRFGETQTIAGRLGEKWTAYGSLANMALARLGGPSPDPAAAYKLASEASERAASGGDRKGVADAGLIAAAAALRLLAGGMPAEPESIRTLLESCRSTFDGLGQRLGAFMATCGLAELESLRPEGRTPGDPAAILVGTSYVGLPPRLLPLPWHMFLLMEVF